MPRSLQNRESGAGEAGEAATQLRMEPDQIVGTELIDREQHYQ